MTSTIQRYQPPPNGNRATAVSQATSIEQSRAIADVQAAVTVAQNCPRDMAEAEREMEYVCGRLDMAEQAFYQVTNRGSGPSVHLMRELARIWGNIDYGVKELARDDNRGESEVLATCWDMQKNTRSSRTFIVPHARMRQGSRIVLTDLGDIYLNNQNVGARAVRECIATILPRWFTEKAQTICRNTLEHGEGEPLQDRINTMVSWFRDKIGVTERQLEARIGKKRGAWSAEDVAQMKIAGASINRGEVGIDELFPPLQAETVADLCAADTEQSADGKSKLSGKVKPAGGESNPGQGGGNDASEGAAARGANRPPDSHDQDVPAAQPAEPPGAPTESTPGQTERVAQALGNARGQKPTLNELLAEAGCKTEGDALAVASSILKHRIQDMERLTKSEQATIRTSLSAWRTVGTLAVMVANILDAADIQAEQAAAQGGEQQTLDSEGNDSNA
jgi:hypothetical protein